MLPAARSRPADGATHRALRERIRTIYREHPQNADRILAHLRRRGIVSPSAVDLASDDADAINDQNHVGGLRATRDLAGAACIGEGSVVLDLCCGLGGSARILATEYGARVRGIDLSPERCEQARRLTQLVGLDQRIVIDCADVMRAPVAAATCDVLWGQSAWVHLRDRDRFVARWTRALRPRGHLAFEDACLLRPAAQGEGEELRQLADLWVADLAPREAWERTIVRHGYRVKTVENLSAVAIAHFEDLLEAARPDGEVPEREVAGWRMGNRLLRTGLLGYIRIVAER